MNVGGYVNSPFVTRNVERLTRGFVRVSADHLQQTTKAKCKVYGFPMKTRGCR